MPVFAQGNINTTALIVPDLYVQIVAPQTLLLNGVPTNTLGDRLDERLRRHLRRRDAAQV
jgi:hypothetical protein